MIEQIKEAIINLRKNKPVILNLTNYVTMDFMANSLLALGAAPIMSVCSSELEELVRIATTININIGTLDDAFIENSINTVKFAKKYNKPIILDPVGAGATKIRTKHAQDLANSADIIRSNASEIIAVAGIQQNTKGVESTNSLIDAKNIAIKLAQNLECVIVVTGPIDFITDGTRNAYVPYGSNLMPLVTGMGCILTAVISAFRTIINDPFNACVLATHYCALCGQLAASTSNHPGAFRTNFIDNIHEADFYNMRKIYEK